ncbi:putative Late nodulin [Medicago truncatula]|uniref:Nodule Cysteine-Rich (NCR) secreted peptide n=1 Tax=Medicago truncatula TaxID=3880 RepID=A7KHA9_MEDTR|nr:nodule-specific cysteine-rich peptide 172 [Medicago truncatula]KEH15669.1 Nodule Cysteine-Rich (NCR) secreted peptide [Medicago truncatula]KEH15795.1 Nodule Cysteine-Rich (NCR) secreted peptide [Medicago truncatula]KEH16303.1 Nodule Cysteine-Rich (NCR) secreted peptide [Medicago truncatula]RHN53094.1 putative Late nodulin [Medicago truncatula]
MANVTKFVYIAIYFLSLFFIAKNDATATFCHDDSHCVTKIKCVLPRTPQCRNEACGCYHSNKFR